MFIIIPAVFNASLRYLINQTVNHLFCLRNPNLDFVDRILSNLIKAALYDWLCIGVLVE